MCIPLTATANVRFLEPYICIPLTVYCKCEVLRASCLCTANCILIMCADNSLVCSNDYPSPISTFTLPYPTLPHQTLLYPTLPYPTKLYPTLLISTLPYPTLPYPTLPYLPTLPLQVKIPPITLKFFAFAFPFPLWSSHLHNFRHLRLTL